MEDFSGRMKYNQWFSLYVLSEVVSCIHLVVDECLKVRYHLSRLSSNQKSSAFREIKLKKNFFVITYMIRPITPLRLDVNLRNTLYTSYCWAQDFPHHERAWAIVPTQGRYWMGAKVWYYRVQNKSTKSLACWEFLDSSFMARLLKCIISLAPKCVADGFWLTG